MLFIGASRPAPTHRGVLCREERQRLVARVAAGQLTLSAIERGEARRENIPGSHTAISPARSKSTSRLNSHERLTDLREHLSPSR